MTKHLGLLCLSLLLAGVCMLSVSSLARAATTALGSDAHCDSPWFYRFNFDGQDVSIEHCGRSDNGSLDYTITSVAAGKLVVYHDGPRSTLRVKVNGRSHTQVVEGRGKWQSEIQVQQGDKVSLLADMGDRPYSGWTSPKDQHCNGFFGAGSLPVAHLYNDISQDGNTLLSAQCWGDGYAYERLLKENYSKPNVTLTCSGSAKDCRDVTIEDMDFNDGAYFLAVDPRIEHVSACEELKITSGNDTRVPAKLTFQAKASDNLGKIQSYRFIFGDGSQLETTHERVDHTYESSGRFDALVEAKDSKGNWISSNRCQVVARVQPAPIESHRSECAYLHIVSGQNQQAPATIKFKVAGFDNKGDVQAYRLLFGDGQQVEIKDGQFEHRYDQPGTYKVKAEIQDSTGAWKSSSRCQQTAYVSTQPITKQPETGTPTWLTVIGLGGGALAFSYPFVRGTKQMNRSLHIGKKKK